MEDDDGVFSVGLSSPVFWIALTCNVLFLVLMRWSTIYGCRRGLKNTYDYLRTIGHVLYIMLS